MPDLLHVIPVAHNAALNGFLESEHAAIGLGFIDHVGVLARQGIATPPHAAGTAYNRREYRTWGVLKSMKETMSACGGEGDKKSSTITSKPSLARSRTTVNDHCLYVIHLFTFHSILAIKLHFFVGAILN
jgi:hypothetical protein